MTLINSVVTTAKAAWKSERLVYRPCDTEDEKTAAWFHEHIRNDPVITALATGRLLTPATKKENKEFIAPLSSSLLAVKICLPTKSEGDDEGATESDLKKDSISDESKNKDDSNLSAIGFIILLPLKGGREIYRASEIGICLVDEYQGHGYGREAINWATDWGFRFAGLHRISINTVSYNQRAIKLYQEMGFKLEGTIRECFYFDRKWFDAVQMGMLENEWEDLRKRSPP